MCTGGPFLGIFSIMGSTARFIWYRKTAGVGIWFRVFEWISIIAVGVNAGLVAFTLSVTAKYSGYVRVWLFGSIIVLVLGLKQIVAFLISDVPSEVRIQLERQEFINRKVIEDEPDDALLAAEVEVPVIDETTEIYI